MKVYQFPARVTPEGSLTLSEGLAELLARSGDAHVIVVVDEPEGNKEQAAWQEMTAAQVLKGYAGVDAIYDRP